MTKLEHLVETFTDDIHRDFRLWLTSTPTQSFPSRILENSIKLTVEPPRGIKVIYYTQLKASFVIKIYNSLKILFRQIC